ncbi:hypothetical protein HZ326_0428 [Fusarium oxysporum f. sp. albedinis]|nr:hypothetical protein HZ326_0428 [Fusarium oxysporum f. sp. albedinis]
MVSGNSSEGTCRSCRYLAGAADRHYECALKCSSSKYPLSWWYLRRNHRQSPAHSPFPCTRAAKPSHSPSGLANNLYSTSPLSAHRHSFSSKPHLTTKSSASALVDLDLDLSILFFISL